MYNTVLTHSYTDKNWCYLRKHVYLYFLPLFPPPHQEEGLCYYTYRIQYKTHLLHVWWAYHGGAWTEVCVGVAKNMHQPFIWHLFFCWCSSQSTRWLRCTIFSSELAKYLMLSRDELQQILLLLFASEFLMLMGYLAFIIEHNENQFVVKSYCTSSIRTGYIGSKDWTSLGKVIQNLSISIKRASEMGTDWSVFGGQ